MKKIKQSLAFLFTIASLTSCDDHLLSKSKEQDQKYLNELAEKIQKSSESVNCENALDWQYTNFGNACSGTNGYIAFSSKIDTAEFLSQVREYNRLHASFNEKYGIVCQPLLNRVPSGIVCENGHAYIEFK